MHDKKPKRIKVFTEDEIKDDLEKYRMVAKESGASDATVIPAEKVLVDKRVRVLNAQFRNARNMGVQRTAPLILWNPIR